MEKTILYIVVPCFNEEEIIEDTAKQLVKKTDEMVANGIINENSKILFVNDGSTDKTEALLNELCRDNKKICMLSFTRNFGHQSALLAGMEEAESFADAVVTIDADLQQDIDALPLFIKEYDNGNEIVLGIRNNRDSDSFFKKVSANCFYNLMNALGSNTIKNSADYRLLSKKAIQVLLQYTETNLFLRGLIPNIGLKTAYVYFDVKARTAGKSKYSFSKMLMLATDGITSFSVKPLRIITVIGFIMLFFSIVMILLSIITFIKKENVPGYTTSVVSIWLVGGVLTTSLGVVGEYIGKIYSETKRRPRYIIKDKINI